jgi:hypothetical protein
VEHRPINAFAEQKLDQNMKLAIARDLQRICSDVLDEPLPTDLRRLIVRLFPDNLENENDKSE